MTKLISGLVLLAATLPVAHAADFDGSKPLICAMAEAMDCVSGDACEKGLPRDFGAPTFVRIDMAKKIVVGPQRTTPIVGMEKSDKQVILQGTELGYGWTVVLDQDDGAVVSTLVNRTGAYVLFGSCTPL